MTLSAVDNDVTVLICTCNNARRLQRTLHSIQRTDTDGSRLREVLVIDNASTDSTKQTVTELQASWPKLRYAHEPKQGKGHAYNLGIELSSGEHILFTDDDVRVPIQWVDRMRAALASGDWDAIAGGLCFDRRYEAIFTRHGLNSIRDWFAYAGDATQQSFGVIVGANMMLRRQVLLDAGPFKTSLGPGAIGFGDETEYAIRLKRLGYRLGPAYEIEVEHRFNLARLHWDSLCAIADKRGATSGYLGWHLNGEEIDPPSWLNWLHYDLPRVLGLPIAGLLWPGARARQLHLRRRWAAIRENLRQREIGPPRWLAEKPSSPVEPARAESLPT